jgi:hypothetical protein
VCLGDAGQEAAQQLDPCMPRLAQTLASRRERNGLKLKGFLRVPLLVGYPKIVGQIGNDFLLIFE